MNERIRWRLICAAGCLVIAALGISPALAGPEVRVGRPCTAAEKISVGQVSHEAFDALLRRYVNEAGQVGYAGWKATPGDVRALEAYLTTLGCADFEADSTREARLAFWINAYNALTLHGILREYPTTSIRNHTARLVGYNIWKDLKLVVGGRPYSLDDIEHQVLRKMGEPRIHLALVCASRGCPPLWNRAYTGDGLDAQLAANGRRYLANPQNFRADPATRTVYMSKLFEWYGTDFGPTPAEQLRALGSMLPAGSEWAATSAGRVEFLSYDWLLNDEKPVGR